MSRDSDGLGALALILAVLLMLVAIAIAVLIWEFLYRQLRGLPTSGAEDGIPLGLFGAPASSWWVERYERWLWRLENVTGANFTSSPERVFAGSMILAGGVGGILATLTGLTALAAGLFADLMTGLIAFLLTFITVFLAVLLVCGLSAWSLGRPAPGWWQSLPGQDDGWEDNQEPGVFLGELKRMK